MSQELSERSELTPGKRFGARNRTPAAVRGGAHRKSFLSKTSPLSRGGANQGCAKKRAPLANLRPRLRRGTEIQRRTRARSLLEQAEMQHMHVRSSLGIWARRFWEV